MNRFRRAMILTLLGGLLAILPGEFPARGDPGLEVLEYDLGTTPLRVMLHPWRERRAITVFAMEEAEGAPARPMLHLLTLEAGGLKAQGRWALPPKTRFLQPLALPGDAPGWLALVASQWQVGTLREDALEWRPFCPCDTIYSHGAAPDILRSSFVFDLDGDGVDEVALPYSQYLEVYRIVPDYLAPLPLGRFGWRANGKSLPREAAPGQGFQLPDFTFLDRDGDGRLELVLDGGDHLRSAALPAAQPGPLVLDERRKALLMRGPFRENFPESMKIALRTLVESAFADPAALLAALAYAGRSTDRSDWTPYLGEVLATALPSLPQATPARTGLPGLEARGPDDEDRLLAMADMDGDGALDVLHARIRNRGSVFKQKNELRWYRGRLEGERLSFAPPTLIMRSDAGSFAHLVRPRTTDAPPLAMLLASTEVSLGTLMKALASGAVTLQVSIRPWNGKALDERPTGTGEFTYREVKAEGRRAMFLIADLNGDGFRDYLLNLERDVLTVYLSADAPPTLTETPLVQQGIALPSRPERVLTGDLDGDGREELVLIYQERFFGALGRRLRVLRFRP